MTERELGERLTGELTVDGATATIHEHGIVLRRADSTVTAWWGLLGLGRPVMVSGDPASAQVMIMEVEVTGSSPTLPVITTLLHAALDGRVVLAPTASPGGDRVDLLIGTIESDGDELVVPVTAPTLAERVP